MYATLDRQSLALDYVAYCASVGHKVNATRTRDAIASWFAIAAAHSAPVYCSPFYGQSTNIRDWVSVECMARTCKCPSGTRFDGEEWNRDHIHDDGYGDSGDALSKLIASGEYPAERLQFLCANCNQAKRRAQRLAAA